MRYLKSFLVIVIWTVLCLAAGSGQAQPTIPKDKIPADLPQDVRAEIERLYSESAIERAYAAVALRKMGPGGAPAVPFLVAMLHDQVALKWVPGGPDTSPRREALLALCEIMDVRAVEALIAALKDSHLEVRARAAGVLGMIKDPRAVEPLIAALKDSNVRTSAAWSLGELKDARAVEPLIAALKDSGSDLRWTAEEALRKIGAPAVEPLIAALKDSHSIVRGVAAYALGKIKDARAVEPLIVASKDSDSDVRESAVEALGEIKDARAVEPLIVALNDPDSGVWWRAEEALRKIGAPAVEPLIAALKDSHLIVRRSAADALKKITRQDFGEDESKWQEWWEKNKSTVGKEGPGEKGRQ